MDVVVLGAAYRTVSASGGGKSPCMRALGPLHNDKQMKLRILIIFEVPADAFGLG